MAVSTKIEMNHLASTPIGMRVTIRAEIKKIEGKRLNFEVEAFDKVEKIAVAYNDMYIIEEERFDKGIKRKISKIKVKQKLNSKIKGTPN